MGLGKFAKKVKCVLIIVITYACSISKFNHLIWRYEI